MMSSNASAASTTTTMKAAVVHKLGDPTISEVLSVENDVNRPVPGKGELLVKVHAASINPIDWKLINGSFPGGKPGGIGADVSGTIVEIGPETNSELKVGDAIYADAIATKASFAEYVVVKECVASPKPNNLSFEEAASLPLAGLTALQGLVTAGMFKKGLSVAILGGSGGVGALAVQMAKALGASHVYATGSSVDVIKSLGADTVINYKEQSVIDELKGKYLDLVFDSIGGVEGWQAAQGALKKGGIFVTIVGDNKGLLQLGTSLAWRKLKSVGGGSPTHKLWICDTSPPAVGKDMSTMTEMVESGKVKPFLDERRFTLDTESVHEMVKASMSHRAKGELVMTVAK